jgi:hypothetical protein
MQNILTATGGLAAIRPSGFGAESDGINEFGEMVLFIEKWFCL